jgi:hypothetical protein
MRLGAGGVSCHCLFPPLPLFANMAVSTCNPPHEQLLVGLGVGALLLSYRHPPLIIVWPLVHPPSTQQAVACQRGGGHSIDHHHSCHPCPCPHLPVICHPHLPIVCHPCHPVICCPHLPVICCPCLAVICCPHLPVICHPTHNTPHGQWLVRAGVGGASFFVVVVIVPPSFIICCCLSSVIICHSHPHYSSSIPHSLLLSHPQATPQAVARGAGDRWCIVHHRLGVLVTWHRWGCWCMLTWWISTSAGLLVPLLALLSLLSTLTSHLDGEEGHCWAWVTLCQHLS